MQRRATFAKHIAGSNAGLTPGRYFRLIAMALVEMFWSLTMIGLNVYFDYRNGLRPWTNWDDVHYDWSRIGQFPQILIPPATLRWTYFFYWTIPISSYLFVAFFVVGRDTFKEYTAVFVKCKKHFTRTCGAPGARKLPDVR